MKFQKIISASLLVTASLSVYAEEEETDTLGVMLDEVNVSAVKQMSRIDREPEAGTAIGRVELERIGATAVKSISNVVPNFYIPDYGSRMTSSIYVRGIGARMDQPSVGLNVDNVPYMNKDAYDFDVADIATVEMLRGPQSTLYGRNTMAGVINVTTLSPMRFQGWRLSLEAASGTTVKASAGWYHKFNDNTGFSVVGAYGSRKGTFVNMYDGEKIDHEQNWNGRIKFYRRFDSSVILQNTASIGNLRQGGYPYEFKETGIISYNDTCFYNRFTFTDGLSLRYSGEKFSVTSITSVQHINDNMTLDQDFLPEEFFTLRQKKRETAFTEDLVVRGVDKGKYRWLNGFFGFYKHLDMHAPVTFKDRGISELIEEHRNDANPLYPISWNERSFRLNSDFKVPVWGISAYHESDLTIGNWNFTAALRVDYEHASLDYRSFCDTGYNIYQKNEGSYSFFREVDIDIDDRGKISKDFLTLLPKVAVSYSLPGEIGNIYVKFSKGYKAGGFNTQMFSDVLQQRLMGIMGIGAQYDIDDVVSYKPEKSWNYEIGSHLSFPEARIEVGLAAFFIDCRDQQLTMFPNGTTTGRIMTNAGRTHSFGGEITVKGNITDYISLSGSYGYTNARFRRFSDGINDYKGNCLPYAPRNTLFLQGVWIVPTDISVLGNISFDVNMRGTGRIFWNESNTESQDFYALLGASVTFGTDDLNLQLWGKNLTDTRYYTFYFMSMGNEFLQRGRGPEIGVTLRYSF
ncbi:MAG: TonB-dependent receptor [Muribaculaceae bacterium]|nr:TonB-dependent receptor [Muribaculaceae bacterium]